MKQDKLEQYVREHRAAFDEQEPNEALFNRIDLRKPKNSRFNLKTILYRAAAVIVIFISSYYFHDYMQYRNRDTANTTSESGKSGQNQLIIELREAQFYYTSQIEETKAVVFQMAGNNTALRHEINSELNDLDKVFRELKEDLKDNANNEEVIVAMIQNYRLKLEILKDILIQLKATDQKNKKDEAKQISI